MTGTIVLTAPEAGAHTDVNARCAVPEALVHRPLRRDVLPTGHRKLTDDHLLVTVRWSAEHPFYAPAHRSGYHALAVPETIRQAAIYLAHSEFGVPLGQHFVMQSLEYTVDPAGLVGEAGGTDLTVDFRAEDVVYRGRQLAAMTCRTVILRDGLPIATGVGKLNCTSPGVYRRLRGERLANVGMPVPLLPAVAPGTVGWRDEADVFLAPSDELGRWQLRVNTGHSTLFHRPNDHVPGMLLLEAAAQAAIAASVPDQLVPVHSEIGFSRYAELDEPCWITTESVPATAGSGAAVVVTGRQYGAEVFRAVFTTAARIGG
jgi:hypothetical protein